ncbi:hypothetical protein SAMN05428989_3139 [Pseudoxanthomonas sp. GM95]|uniref:hypothetical protein n=1 Tax=Pseudoxanthomonas sp. GM95 TaxID=1881043 RepID=UPI0008ABD2E5|nr:hypothetical protein [Pseudoxanthomonas sp. GM95]SEM12893.1 hypothetical protein SAMN05428989_3139 [Pseudoxanthomonas sp. GM95]
MAGKWLAAILLGLPLSTALVGLIVLLWPGKLEVHTLPLLLLSFPVWIGVMAAAFACRSGARAWLWLGGATLLCFGALYAVKALGWAAVPA